MTTSHFGPIEPGKRNLVERLNRRIRSDELLFTQLSSVDFADSVSGFKIEEDGTAQFNAGMTVGGDAQLGDVDITGNLTMTGSGLIRTAPSGDRIEITTWSGGNNNIIMHTSDTAFNISAAGKLFIITSTSGGDKDSTYQMTEDGGGTGAHIFTGESATVPTLRVESWGAAPIAVFTNTDTPSQAVVAQIDNDGGMRATQFIFYSDNDNRFYIVDPDEINVDAGGSAVGKFTSAGWVGDVTGTLTGNAATATDADTVDSMHAAEFVAVAGDQMDGNLDMDADVKFVTEGDGIVSADGSDIMQIVNDGILVENIVTNLPSWVSAAPADITSFAGTAFITTPNSTITLWTHGGTDRNVRIEAMAVGQFAKAAAVLYTGHMHIQVSWNGGSTWTTGAEAFGYVGTNTGGAGYRLQRTVLFSGEGSASGDVQVRMQHKVSNTGMARFEDLYIQAQAWGVF